MGGQVLKDGGFKAKGHGDNTSSDSDSSVDGRNDSGTSSSSDDEMKKAKKEKSLVTLNSKLYTVDNGPHNNTIVQKTGAPEGKPAPDYYNGEEDYYYSYEWNDSARQETGEDYSYSYEWEYKPELHEAPYTYKNDTNELP